MPVGTRLCAYWSQQYRCLYPGRAIESESSDDDVTAQEFVSVEFDDGDSGRIRLQNIRFLLSDYPQVGKCSTLSFYHIFFFFCFCMSAIIHSHLQCIPNNKHTQSYNQTFTF